MKFDDYQEQSRKTMIVDGPGLTKLYYCALGLTNEAGEVAGKVKKVIRDRNGRLDAEAKEMIAAELGDVLWYIARVADEVDIKLGDLAQGNLDKLLSRMDRGKIKGDGDKR